MEAVASAGAVASPLDRQLDISRVAAFRRTIARAAISLNVAGVVLGYWAAAFTVGLLSSLVEPGLLTSLAVMAAFSVPIWLAFRSSRQLRGGSGNPAGRLAAWLAIYLVALFARWPLSFLQGARQASDYSVGPDFVFETFWLVTPGIFMALGLRAIRKLPSWPSDSAPSTPLDASPWEAARGSRHPVFLNSRPARFYLYVSYVVLVGAIVAWSFLSSLRELEHPIAVVGGLMAPLMFTVILIARPFRRARRHSLQNVDETLKHDQRPPVLYLRSFLDDRLTMSARTANGRVWLERFSPHTFEEVVCDHLWRYGPVVALGMPGDKLPPLGAVRNYFEGDEWRSGVQELMRQASVIVLALGRTESLQWELERLAASNLLSRTIVVVPPVKPGEVNQRWATLHSTAAKAMSMLPEAIDAKHTLALAFPAGAPPQLVTSTRRDDWAYEAAIDAAVASTVGVKARSLASRQRSLHASDAPRSAPV